jgi:hypothetical protein
VRIAFLGCGYTGQFFSFSGDETLRTSRSPTRADRPGWGRFDSTQPDTWPAVRHFAPDGVVVAFPLSGASEERGLGEFLLALSPRLVCLGTTAALAAAAGVVDDGSPLLPDNPRALAEEGWRQRGATVLHAAGIYGPGRNPLDWLRRRRIANAGKLVNLVHGEDVARACRFVLEHFSPGERLVISDGRPRRWREIVAFAVQRGHLADPQLPDRPDPTSKRVVPRLLPERGFTLIHPDLFVELDILEGKERS